MKEISMLGPETPTLIIVPDETAGVGMQRLRRIGSSAVTGTHTRTEASEWPMTMGETT